MRGMRLFVVGMIAAAAVMLTACPGVDEPTFEEMKGPIEDILDEVSMTVWPGVVQDDGVRHIRRINGFFQGEATGYWFANFASKNSPDVFWFCEEGDTACPFDEDGVVDRTRTLGNPVFSTMPGEADFSPFWLAWVVRVPADYEANSIKSVYGIEQAELNGEVAVEQVIFDHGGEIGPAQAIHHCLLVLTGTELEGNGEDLMNQPGVPSHYLPPREGWFRQYAVEFYDFTDNEGVFPPAETSESRPKMPHADIFVFFRDCEGGSDSMVCDFAASSAEAGAVSERGIEEDFTTDGDKGDTNNIISGFPGVVNEGENADDAVYSPLWRVMMVMVPPENDDKFELLDGSLDQNVSDIKSLRTMEDYVEQGLLREPTELSEAQAGNSIPGNDGILFFNCPSQRGER